MKRKLVSLLLVSVMSLSFVACGTSDTEDQEDIQEEVQEESAVSFATPTELVTAIDSIIIGEETLQYMIADADMIEMTYGLTPDMYTAIEARTPMMSAVCDELVVVQFAEGQEEAIVTALEARQTYLADPANGGYPEHIEFANDYNLHVVGDMVVFSVGLHADKAVEVLGL